MAQGSNHITNTFHLINYKTIKIVTHGNSLIIVHILLQDNFGLDDTLIAH